ncbi:hypothetical protein [Mycolicibacterium smegmatis]|nr:hypothetical protein [Mycolicibacterium smegmatis]MCC3339085.1 hypothetical protein [Mycolicibacterium smegmatis]MCO4196925.1 hypothetical protein [Mycolicibacterium smegmatis]MCP2621661.1 hypothetical protein [Mycolicibacterium smegmatis]MCP2623380.1 hypothetical protein [Mycolicibacterium smegmatis]MDF1902827.1 hypothetical protein [Mycolicibacterium smegmatis]
MARAAWFQLTDRREQFSPRAGSVRLLPLKEVIPMKKIGVATMIAGGVVGAVVGLAAPAAGATSGQTPAGISSVTISADRHRGWIWIYPIQPHVYVPHVSTEVHQSR